VTSLFEHEQIRTTLAKAKDTARLAEKVRLRCYLLQSAYA
jgi:ribosomal protein L17